MIGAVRFGQNEIAEVYFNEQWAPICGHWFWENDVGAGLFCQQLGFTDGVIIKKHEVPLPSDGLRVGLCNQGDDWLHCSDKDCNQLEIGGQCDNGASCESGAMAAVSIECSNSGKFHNPS